MTDLTFLVVSEYGPHAAGFLSRLEEIAEDVDAGAFVEFDGTGASCIEDVLDEAVGGCDDGWILRLDDDELPSPEMVEWLRAGGYRDAFHWAFPRLHLWPDASSYIASAALYPDLQTRLSLKQFSGGRTQIHVGSPFGTGQVAPVAIEHHKFLVRSLGERRALLERYERISPGAGRGFWQFSVPEDLPDVDVVVRERAAA